MIKNSKAKDTALIAMMAAIIIVCKVVLAQLPNIELTSFFIILFTLFFGKKTLFVIPIFILSEILIFGFEIMWVTAYIYVWPLLFILTMLLRKIKSTYSMAMLSGVFGLGFGFLCSFPYIFVTSALNPNAGIQSAIAWWIAGIPFDIIHCVSNFFIMLVLYKPISNVMQRALQTKQF